MNDSKLTDKQLRSLVQKVNQRPAKVDSVGLWLGNAFAAARTAFPGCENRYDLARRSIFKTIEWSRIGVTCEAFGGHDF